MTRGSPRTIPAAYPDRMPPWSSILLALIRGDGADWPMAAEELQAIDWEPLLLEADKHRVTPLLYHRLLTMGQLDRLPGNVTQALHRAFHAQWGKNLLRLRTLEHVLGLLDASGIRPIALKGAGLVLTVYDELAVRPIGDIDLLVAPEEFRPALQHLLDAGGRVTHGEPFDGAYEVVTHHVTLLFPAESRVLVELHHQWLSLPLRQANLVTMAELRSRAQTVRMGHTSVEAPGAEDQVLHLSGHLSLHSPAMERLIWYYDVDQVIRQAGSRLDWEAILQRALRYQMVLPLRYALATAVEAFGTPVPGDVFDRLIDLPVSAAERQRYGEAALGPRSRLGDGVQKLAGLDSTAAKLRFAWNMIFPAWDFMQDQYPADSPARLVGRYPARWVEVLREFADRSL